MRSAHCSRFRQRKIQNEQCGQDDSAQEFRIPIDAVGWGTASFDRLIELKNGRKEHN